MGGAYATLFKRYSSHSSEWGRSSSTLKQKLQRGNLKINRKKITHDDQPDARPPNGCCSWGKDHQKKLWTRLYNQYHEVGWRAKWIFSWELICLKQSECEDTDSYVAKFRVLYLRFSNMAQKLDNRTLVYMLFSSLGDEHASWATTVWNDSRKDAEPPQFDIITALFLDKA